MATVLSTLTAKGATYSFQEFVDVNPVKSLYLSSYALGERTSLGCRGESTIIRKIILDRGFGAQIDSIVQNAFDHIDISGQTLSTLDFQLRDSFGRLVNMSGKHCNFSLVLIDKTIF